MRRRADDDVAEIDVVGSAANFSQGSFTDADQAEARGTAQKIDVARQNETTAKAVFLIAIGREGPLVVLPFVREEMTALGTNAKKVGIGRGNLPGEAKSK